MKWHMSGGTVVIGLLVSSGVLAAPLGTAFTYQGQLKHAGAAVDDSTCYFTFNLWTDSSCSCGPTPGMPSCTQRIGSVDQTAGAIDGLFTVQLDFGAVFAGQATWLQTAVCCAPNPVSPAAEASCLASKVTLAPCQPMNAVPYALGLRLPMTEGVTGTMEPGIAVTHLSEGHAIRGSSNGCVSAGCTMGAGVFGENTSSGPGVSGTSVNGNGVEGVSSYFAVSGVYGENKGSGYGVAGRTSGPGTAIYGDNPNSAGWAGYFTGKVYAAGGFDSGNADVAERIDSTDLLDPGDVVEIDPAQHGSFRRAATPYSPLTAGIVSTAPAMVLGSRGKDAPETGVRDPILALAGSVPVKVTTANGPIKAGDLLTTSAVPGHAMRCDDRVKCVGAIVGKALESLDAGTGTVKALVSLQ